MHVANMRAKIARATQIHAAIIELNTLFGRNAPTPFRWVQPFVRLVRLDGEPWSARILPDTYVGYARISDKNTGDVHIQRDGWMAMEVYIRDRCRRADNVRGDDLLLQRFEPGLCETWVRGRMRRSDPRNLSILLFYIIKIHYLVFS